MTNSLHGQRLSSKPVGGTFGGGLRIGKLGGLSAATGINRAATRA
jgi:hypothetical protein